MSVQRYFIYLAYDGTNYHGWQIQPNGISVQERLQDSLSKILRQKIDVVGAGRTAAPCSPGTASFARCATSWQTSHCSTFDTPGPVPSQGVNSFSW